MTLWILTKTEKNTFFVGGMTQYMLTKACVYIVAPQQKWILLFKIKPIDEVDNTS